MFHRLSLAFLVLAALVTGACSKDSSTTGEPAQRAMGLYAKGFNALIKDPKQMIEEYFDKIPETGPVIEGSSKLKLFPRQNFAGNAIKTAREAFAEARSSAPATMAELATHADAALAAITKVEATFTAAQKYYDAENYQDDKLAKGTQLHTEMLAATKQFTEALGKLEAGLSKIEDDQAAVEIAKHAGAKGYSYWFRFYNAEAKKFLSAVERGEGLDAAFAALGASTTELAAFAASKGTQLNATFKTYAGMGETFHGTATKLVRQAKAPTPDEAAADRERQALVSNYNNLVQLGNSLYDLEAAKALE